MVDQAQNVKIHPQIVKVMPPSGRDDPVLLVRHNSGDAIEYFTIGRSTKDNTASIEVTDADGRPNGSAPIRFRAPYLQDAFIATQGAKQDAAPISIINQLIRKEISAGPSSAPKI